jgi:hypothetical protein
MSKQTKATEQTKSVEKKVIKSKETKAAPKETKAAPKEVIISGEEPINPPLSKVELGTTGLEYTELEATRISRYRSSTYEINSYRRACIRCSNKKRSIKNS